MTKEAEGFLGLPLDDSHEQAFSTPEGESYKRVEKALKDLTYRDKTGIVYFSIRRVRDEIYGEDTSMGFIRPFIEIQNKLEELVSKGKATPILGDLGLDSGSKTKLYRYI